MTLEDNLPPVMDASINPEEYIEGVFNVVEIMHRVATELLERASNDDNNHPQAVGLQQSRSVLFVESSVQVAQLQDSHDLDGSNYQCWSSI